uniref:AlNc14C332G10700 protein n=1 Tax=Albugo laibachii Nc14 TaxID=890382 RepID=F0WWT7_9STRA|nr:AlNc14C332G10700 [Albugo laibachii Nc14]|eukprot:CCA25914.1 AlNc14C332G10700 [Albugo laibachii Nc14]
MSDLQDLITHRVEEAYATFLDLQKAYDQVEWSYMFAVLSKMNCGASAIQWTKLLYTKTNVPFFNGTISSKITPSRRVKQGNPLSVLLIVMTIEPLGNLLQRLWHFKTPFDISQHILRRWQSMLNRFVLSRKYERDSAHMQLIRSEILYLPSSKAGLQVPMIEKQLKKQHIPFLQQFAI